MHDANAPLDGILVAWTWTRSYRMGTLRQIRIRSARATCRSLFVGHNLAPKLEEPLTISVVSRVRRRRCEAKRTIDDIESLRGSLLVG